MKKPNIKEFMEYIQYLEKLKTPKSSQLQIKIPSTKVEIVGVGSLNDVIAHYTALPVLITECYKNTSFNFYKWDTARNRKVKDITININ